MIALLASGIASAFAVPEPGLYVGTVTITKRLSAEGLSSTYTLKAQGRVAPDGSITFLTSVPQAPSAAIDVDSTVTRAALVDIPIPEPEVTPLPYAGPLPPRQVSYKAYVIDGQFRADVAVTGRVLTVRYQAPVGPPPIETSPNHYTLTVSPKSAVISFKLVKQK